MPSISQSEQEGHTLENVEQARKTQTFGEFTGMNSQNERYGLEKEEFFWLENIQPIGSHKLASIPGPGATFVTIPGGGSRHIVQLYQLNVTGVGEGPFIICSTDDGTVWAVDVTQQTLTQINGTYSLQSDFALSVWQGTTGLFVTEGGGYFVWPSRPDPPPVVALGAAGNVDVGNHTWRISFISTTNEGGMGTTTATLNVTPASHVSLTNIPLGPPGVTARRIYRNKVADQQHWFLVGVIADNTTTTFDDNVADSGLGAAGSDFGKLILVDGTLGTAVESFAGRVWISNDRTTQFTSPNSYFDRNPANAAGSFVMTDSAFVGSIVQLFSSLDALWIFGEAAINQVSNVTVPASTTTTLFSNVNISSSVGTIFPRSVLGYLRQINFATQYGVIQQIGVTPQRISDKIDGTFSKLDLTKGVSAAIFTLNNVLCYGLMVTYNDPDTGSQRKIILCFTQDGKWFVASQGDSLLWMASVEAGGTYRTFATDGLIVKELFTTAGYNVHRLKTPLNDYGDVTAGKEFHRVMAALEFPLAVPINATLVPQTQSGAKIPLASTRSSQITFIGSGPIQFIGAGPANLNFLGKGYALAIWTVGLIDKLIGFDLSFDSDPFYLLAYAIDYQVRESWGDVRA